MDKRRPSSKGKVGVRDTAIPSGAERSRRFVRDTFKVSSRDFSRYRGLLIPSLGMTLLVVLCAAGVTNILALTLSHGEALRIGNKVWQNECGGSVAGLTSWNEGENFASLGIGHFIWYPKGVHGPFEESFPKLVSFISARGAKLPRILLGVSELHCPWSSRAEFLRAQQTSDMRELRRFLADTVDVQAEFLVARLQGALPKMLAEAAPSQREIVEQNFNRVARTAAGCYALVDYVNFKGEGVLPSERYKDEGWGLLQVLSEMRPTAPEPVNEFSRAASAVLRRRVANSPPERHETRWLSGWLHRVNSYSRN